MYENLKILGWLFLVTIILGGFVAVFGGEREGIVSYEGCQEVIPLKSDTLQKFYKKFTCNYNKSSDGSILGGTCTHIENYSSWNSHDSSCKVAYFYEKGEEDIFPMTNEKCDSSGCPQYEWYDRHNVPMAYRCYSSMENPCTDEEWNKALHYRSQ